jgi:hypothetical protein
MTVPKKPNEAKRAEISRIVRERDPQNEAQLMTIADEIPMADVLEAVGMPADVFYRLSPEQREQIGKPLVLNLAWDEALTRVVPPAGEASSREGAQHSARVHSRSMKDFSSCR